MLEHLGEEKSGKDIEKAVMQVTANHIQNLAAGQMGISTSEAGDLVVKYI
jgi:3-isopropylmalate dehydrogenase